LAGLRLWVYTTVKVKLILVTWITSDNAVGTKCELHVSPRQIFVFALLCVRVDADLFAMMQGVRSKCFTIPFLRGKTELQNIRVF
jgi:hypothetical protein